MRNLLFHHEYSDGMFWYDENACIQDFEEKLDYIEIIEMIQCISSPEQMVEHGLKGDASWFQDIYDEAVTALIAELVYDDEYTDDEIEDFIIMDEE